MDVKLFGEKNLNRGRLLNDRMQKTMEKLSSGYRINRAGDDAAGLAVSEKLCVELSEQQQCVQNVRHGTNLARTADAALQEVNDMMKRAETLCLQAQNGTYSEVERQSLTDELNAIYDEMERIFSGAEFNDIKLFQYSNQDDVGDFPHQFKEYIEKVVEKQDGYAEWGDLRVVNNEWFDLAEDAKNATASIQLDSEVKLNDASTLIDKSFYMRGDRSGYDAYITFTEDKSSTNFRQHDDGSYYYEFNVPVKDLSSVQEAMDKLCATMKNNGTVSANAIPTSITVDDSGLVTFDFGTAKLVQNINGVSYGVENGAGAKSNGVVISGKEQAMLDAMDEGENKVTYSETGKVNMYVMSNTAKGTVLTDAQKKALAANTLTVDDLTIDFSEDEANGFVTVDDVRAAVAAKITGDNISATVDANTGMMTITKTDCTTDKADPAKVQENVLATSSTVTSNAPAISFSSTPPTAESPEKCTLTVSDKTLPLSLNINGNNYVFYEYDSMKNQTASGTNMWSTSASDLMRNIGYAISGAYGNKVSCTVTGDNTITLQGKFANESIGVQVSEGTAVDISVTQRAFMTSGYYSFSQEHTLPIDLQNASINDLNGRGFTLNYNGRTVLYEFNDDTEPKKIKDAVLVDTKGCTTMAEVAAKLQTVLREKHNDANLRVEESDGKLGIVGSSYMTFTDGKVGMDGLFNNSEGTVSTSAAGGSDTTQPGKEINFSSYNAGNLDELYGKGFRVTCATCENEYINVMFCNDKNEAVFPEEFALLDENGDPVKDQNGKEIVIKNCVVELKGMSSGADIVRSIVEQLNDSVLDHFTEVAVGDPESVLVVRDKRAGNILKEGSVDDYLQAKILTGVKTNCTYELTILRHDNPDAYITDPANGITAFFGYCPIYAGDTEGKAEWIPVHLPNLSLNRLNLDPPRPDLTQVDTIDDVCSRLKIADRVISTARGQLGADQNRLDHAKMNLTTAAEQTADAYSRIRDLDMAEGMTEQVKLSILQQTQQSSLVHIHQQGSEVLKLMQ